MTNSLAVVTEFSHLGIYWSKILYSTILTLASEAFAGDSGPDPGYVLLILWSVWDEVPPLDRLRALCEMRFTESSRMPHVLRSFTAVWGTIQACIFGQVFPIRG